MTWQGWVAVPTLAVCDFNDEGRVSLIVSIVELCVRGLRDGHAGGGRTGQVVLLVGLDHEFDVRMGPRNYLGGDLCKESPNWSMVPRLLVAVAVAVATRICNGNDPSGDAAGE